MVTMPMRRAAGRPAFYRNNKGRVHIARHGCEALATSQEKDRLRTVFLFETLAIALPRRLIVSCRRCFPHGI